MARVLYLVNSLEVGGVEVLVARMVRWLKARGDDPSVICIDQLGPIAKELGQSGISVTSLGRPPEFSLKTVWALGRRIDKAGISVVHTHNWGAFVYGVLSLAFLPGKGHVHTQHSIPEDFAGLRKLGAGLLGRRVTHWVAVSSHVAEFLIESKWCPHPSRLSTILNGVESKVTPTDLEALWGLRRDGEEAWIVCVGRLVRVKDHRTLLTAFKSVLAEQKKAVLILVGEGPLRGELEAFSRSLGIDQSVRFLGYRNDVQEILKRAAVFALSSLSEGNSVAVLEAMSMGLPIVATRVGGNAEILKEGETGLLVPVGDAKALSQAILRLLTDEALSKRLSAEALETVRERYHFDAMMAQYLKRYNPAQ